MRRLLLLFLFLIPISLFAQDVPDVNAHSPKPKKTSGVEKKAEKVKERQKSDIAKADERERKRAIKIQEKEVRKRMKKSKHTAKLYNENKKEFFLVRWFRKKRP